MKAVLYESFFERPLEILGSHGMQAWRYDSLLAMIESKKLTPERLIGKTISLEDSIDALVNMDRFDGSGVTVITQF
jgi:alcohol dehydrogenase